MIKFTKHARQKFKILKEHSFSVNEKEVADTVLDPELIDHSRAPLIIAQRKLDAEHVLRVVYKEEGGDKIIITFYPGRRKQYEKRS